MFSRLTLAPKLFPTIGFRIITELSSLEDLPDLETIKAIQRTGAVSYGQVGIATV
jgi:hypothetical protein